MTERLVARTAIMRPIGVTRPPWNPYLGECCGVLWTRSQGSCIYVYACDRERCRGENMHLHALRVPALGWDTGHACHHIEKKRDASVSVYVYGEDSNRASDRWLRPTIARCGYVRSRWGAFALDQLLTGSFTGRLCKLEPYALYPVNRGSARGCVRYQWAWDSDVIKEKMNKCRNRYLSRYETIYINPIAI